MADIIVGFLKILGSLGLFLYGMMVMSSGIQKIAGEKLRALLQKMVYNRFVGILTGFLITCLVQSSSATTVMVVSFVNASLLTVFESISVIMGANLGTTTTFWVISAFGFKFSLSKIALPVIGIGLPLLFTKSPKTRDLSEIFIGFGLLFLGLSFLKESIPDIKNNPETFEFIKNYENLPGILSVLVFVFVGLILTLVVQSSSVAGAITLTMAAKGWITYESACAIILGENIGTTITANIAAISANINAKRSALAHFCFNIFGVIWVIIAFKYFVQLVDWVLPGSPTGENTIALHLALFHTMFNFTNIILLVGFIPLIAKIVTNLIKTDDGKIPKQEHLVYISSKFAQIGELNIPEANQAINTLSSLTVEVSESINEILTEKGSSISKKVKKIEDDEVYSDKLAHEINQYLIRCSVDELSEGSISSINYNMSITNELEDICDCFAFIADYLSQINGKKDKFSNTAQKELIELSNEVQKFIKYYHEHLNSVTKKNISLAQKMEDNISVILTKMQKSAMKRMKNKKSVKTHTIYLNILNQFGKIASHATKIVKASYYRR